MRKSLDHKSFVPLYHQLKEIIERTIETGEWNPGDKILSENEFRELYEVSRNTVQKAIDELVQEGVLERKQGRGTFVSKPKIDQPLIGFYSFSKVISSQGMVSKDIILDIQTEQVHYNLAQELQIANNEEVISLKRLRTANGEPIILETSYLPKKYVSEIKKQDLDTYSLYDLLEKKHDVFVVKAKETFEPVLVREEEGELLEVEAGSPGLLLDRIAYDLDGNIIEYCRSIVRGDRCRFYTELL
ncbi:MAG TPA: GntR family transcriptional regulator [Pseudogracilibacillus sp.]|nr:GntR family transcriptional regulator [Pseudogracilibacillus sp.]